MRGIRNTERIPMIMITASSSISVKPRRATRASRRSGAMALGMRVGPGAVRSFYPKPTTKSREAGAGARNGSGRAAGIAARPEGCLGTARAALLGALGGHGGLQLGHLVGALPAEVGAPEVAVAGGALVDRLL